MRIGIFSDTHANYEALSAVLEAYRSEHIDCFYCLGDTVGYGGSPNECADLVRKVAKKTILGNHDAAVAGRMDYSYYYEAARHALDAHSKMLTSENLAWLKSLTYQEKLTDIGVDLCHGSPVRLEEFEYIFAPEQARECLPIWEELGHLTLIGHSQNRRPSLKYAVGWPSVMTIICWVVAGCRSSRREATRSPSWRLVKGSPMVQVTSARSEGFSSTARV